MNNAKFISTIRWFRKQFVNLDIYEQQVSSGEKQSKNCVREMPTCDSNQEVNSWLWTQNRHRMPRWRWELPVAVATTNYTDPTLDVDKRPEKSRKEMAKLRAELEAIRYSLLS